MDNVFTTKHWSVICAMVVLIIGAFGVISTKADKDEVKEVEQRMVQRVKELKQDFKEMRSDIESGQDRMHDLLIDIKQQQKDNNK